MQESSYLYPKYLIINPFLISLSVIPSISLFGIVCFLISNDFTPSYKKFLAKSIPSDVFNPTDFTSTYGINILDLPSTKLASENTSPVVYE